MKKSAASLLTKKIDSGSDQNDDFDNEVFICNEPDFEEIENSQVKSETVIDSYGLQAVDL